MHKKENARKLFYAGLILMVAAFACYQLFNLLAQSIQTQTALQATEYDTVDARLLVVRDEKLVRAEGKDTLVPLIQNGERVGKDDPLALRFASAAQADIYLEIQALNKSLQRYGQFQASAVSHLDLQKLDREIDGIFLSLLDTVAAGNYEASGAIGDTLLDKLTVRQVAVSGNIKETEAQKKQKARLKELNKSGSKEAGEVKAEAAGYFVAGTDGYEDITAYGGLKSLSAAQIEALLEAKPAAGQTAYGKLICSYVWYLVTTVEGRAAASLQVGGKYKLLLDNYPEEYLEVTLDSLGAEENGRLPLVFACNLMNETLSGLRLERARLVLREYSGLKISRDAVRVLEEEKGVYVRRGNMLNFRRLDVVFETAEFVVAKADAENKSTTTHVQLYDEVVTKGRNLYERKVVR